MAAKVEDEKRELRRRFRFERSQRSLGGDWLHLLDANEIKSAASIASYISYGDEPTTTLLNQSILQSGKRLLLPRVNDDDSITWIIWTQDSRLEKSKRRSKILQPSGEEFTGKIDVIIAPALRVDRSGARLGQGGGSYDRAFATEVARQAWKVVLLHDEEVSTEPLPTEAHDIRVDAVALPEIVVRFKTIG